MTSTPAKTIDWSKVSQRLERDHAKSTSLNRVLKAPLRTGLVMGMRQVGLTRPIAARLPWGDVFHGHLPEAVTSVIWRTGHYVDIGAHFGYFTLLASRLVGSEGKVVAVEAMPSTFALLKENVVRNGLENVQLHNCAAFSKDTTLQFKEFGVVHSSLNTAFSPRGVLEGQPAQFREIAVAAVPVDRLLEPYRRKRVAMIKIDAESSEEFVLEGLAETLSINRPILLIELGGSATDDADRLEAIAGSLRRAGYQGMRWQEGSLEKIPGGRALPYDNYIFIHSQ
jgi:FkbM family methyltransferase